MKKVGKGRLERQQPLGGVTLRILLQAVITYMGVSYHLELNSMIAYWGLQGLKATLWNLAQSFDPFSLIHFMLLPGFCLMYTVISRLWDRDGEKTWNTGQRKAGHRLGVAVHLPAALFAGMMVLGWSFAKYNSVRLVLTLKHGQLIKSFLVFWGYDLLFRYLIQYAYLKFALGFPRLDSFHPARPRILRWYGNKLRKAPFRTAALTLLILYLPLMLVSYPGMIVADTVGQTLRGFPEFAEVDHAVDPGRLGKLGAHLNNHHPVAHTMLIHLCLSAGYRILHSWNAGFYLYAILQELAFICVVAFLLREYIRRYGVSKWYAICILIYVFASPLIHNYVILTTKDTFYALFLLMTVYFWYCLLTEGGRKNLLLLLLFATGTVMFRNEGQYVLTLAAIGSICLNRKTRKRFAVVLIYLMAFSVAYFHVLFPVLGIAPGSRREMLSIPFQQTARYIVNYGNQVTPMERAAIDAVLDYDKIPEAYDPGLADPIKDLYPDQDASLKELARYMICWAKMGLKHPETYISAFLNNKYKYFYPDQETLSVESYKRTSFLFSWHTELAEKVGIAPAQPVGLKWLRDIADDAQGWLINSTPLNILVMTSLYPVIVILLLCYSLRRRDPVLTSVVLIPFIVLLVCLAGPTNGEYSRYTMPLALIWPFLDPIICARRNASFSEVPAEEKRQVIG